MRTTKRQLRLLTLVSLSIFPMIFLLIEKLGLSLIKIEPDTVKSMLNTIITTTGSIVAFLVIYLSISFENFKKNYGEYASEFFATNNLILSFLLLLLFTMSVGFITFTLTDISSFFKMYLFNISCSYFLLILILIIPYGYLILKESSSIETLKELVDKITPEDLQLHQSSHFSIFNLAARDDKNNFLVLGEILILNCTEKNTKNVTIISGKLYERLQKFINDRSLYSSAKENMIVHFCTLIKEMFIAQNTNRNRNGVMMCLALLNDFNDFLARSKYRGQATEKIFEISKFITRTFISEEQEAMIHESFWVHYHISKSQLENNIPPEEEMWIEEPEDSDWYIRPINTDEAYKQSRHFESVETFMTYDLAGLVDRTFLSANYYITDESVRLVSNFIPLLEWSHNLGKLHKYTIGRTLAYDTNEAIKKLALSDKRHNTHLLSYHVGEFFLADLLKENSKFSNEIFKSYVDLASFLLEKSMIDHFDIDDLIGLSRLIVADADKIKDKLEYIRNLVELLDAGKRKFERQEEKNELRQQIISGLQSLLGMLSDKQYKNDLIKELIIKKCPYLNF